MLLFVLQALGSTVSVALVTVNSIAGLRLAPSERWATLPITAFVVGSAMTTFFASLFMAKFGRATGFRLAALACVAGSGVCALAVALESFAGLCVGAGLFGGFAAFVAYTRFSASEVAPENYRSRAISWVMTAGIAGAVLGPESTKWTKDLFTPTFVGTYLSLALLGVLFLLTTLGLRLPPPQIQVHKYNRRDLLTLWHNDPGRTAIIAAVVGYAVMVFLMTATPIAMTHHHHHYNDAAFVIQWHVLGMYAPSFVTGSLIKRFGVLRIILTGCGLMLLCAGLNLMGTSVMHFWTSLVLLGIGWNFMFIGGTTLLASTFSGDERFFAQGTNEALVFGSNALASASSGLLLHQLGWQLTNYIVAPFVLLAIGACVHSIRHNARVAKVNPSLR